MTFRERTEIVFGAEGMEKLAESSVAIFGLGGVGASAAMDLIRCGVGRLILTDFDEVSESNLNRLIIGYGDTIGKNKVEMIKKLGKSINPDLEVVACESFIRGEDSMDHIDEADFYIDAIDSLNPKVNLIISLQEMQKQFISSMGAGGRIDPSRLLIGSIWSTIGCPFAAVIRKRLRKRKATSSFPVVFSTEKPVPPVDNNNVNHDNMGRVRKTQGSTPFVPQAAGHLLAFYAVKQILGI